MRRPAVGRSGAQPKTAAPRIDVLVQSTRWKKQPGAVAIVRRAVTAAAKAASTPDAELAIVLTHDSAIRTLNRDWRGFDKPTNVLSFPAQTSHASKTRRTRSSAMRKSVAPAAVPIPLGDIVIAFETTAREAISEGKPLRHHLTHLAVHGFLHLLGYDHENDRDARKMEQFETKILATLRVPDPYAESKPSSRRDV